MSSESVAPKCKICGALATVFVTSAVARKGSLPKDFRLKEWKDMSLAEIQQLADRCISSEEVYYCVRHRPDDSVMWSSTSEKKIRKGSGVFDSGLCTC
jgi:hypothetical protein